MRMCLVIGSVGMLVTTVAVLEALQVLESPSYHLQAVELTIELA
jgi:hypothetical protein